MSTPTPSIAHMVESILDAYGWTQAQLAQRVGLTQASINRLLQGESRTTSYEPGSRLAALYAARPVTPVPRAEKRGRPRKGAVA